MSRAAIHKDEFTPFGLWIKEYADPCMTVTNIDYFLLKIVGENVFTMLLEEKTNAGRITDQQMLAMRFLHQQLCETNNKDYDFDQLRQQVKWGIKKIIYWGFFILRFSQGCTMPGPGMCLNNETISDIQLRDHISFKNKFCDGSF